MISEPLFPQSFSVKRIAIPALNVMTDQWESDLDGATCAIFELTEALAKEFEKLLLASPQKSRGCWAWDMQLHRYGGGRIDFSASYGGIECLYECGPIRYQMVRLERWALREILHSPSIFHVLGDSQLLRPQLKTLAELNKWAVHPLVEVVA